MLMVVLMAVVAVITVGTMAIVKGIGTMVDNYETKLNGEYTCAVQKLIRQAIDQVHEYAINNGDLTYFYNKAVDAGYKMGAQTTKNICDQLRFLNEETKEEKIVSLKDLRNKLISKEDKIKEILSTSSKKITKAYDTDKRDFNRYIDNMKKDLLKHRNAIAYRAINNCVSGTYREEDEKKTSPFLSDYEIKQIITNISVCKTNWYPTLFMFDKIAEKIKGDLISEAQKQMQAKYNANKIAFVLA